MSPSPTAEEEQTAELRVLRQYVAHMSLLGQLERKVRLAENLRDLGFLIVNETHTLTSFRQAVLWLAMGGHPGRVAAISGVVDADPRVPYVDWLTRVLQSVSSRRTGSGLFAFSAGDLAETEQREWSEWFADHALWCPLTTRDGANLGGFVLVRENAWSEGDQKILTHLAETFAHAMDALAGKRHVWWQGWHSIRGVRLAGWVVVFLLLGSMWLPVRQSALAPAEVTARDPTVVRAPLEGVVDQFHVQPNAPIESGQLLLTLDDVTLKNRLEVAKRTLDITRAKHQQAAQQAVFDKKIQSQLEILKREMEKQAAESDYLQTLLNRVRVHTPRSGIAIFDDVNDWIGRPVAMGEKILMVADPKQAELVIQLPVGNAIPLWSGADVTLFLTIDPEHPIAATLYFVSYQPTPVPEGFLAYRLKGRFHEEMGDPPRIGLKGTAKVYGRKVTLFHFLFRRPLAALRQTLGW